jgi:hypothetical protein
MDKLIAAVSLLLSSGLALAANLADAANAPVDTVSPIYVVLFLILFFGMIAGYLVWVWRSDKNRAEDR